MKMNNLNVLTYGYLPWTYIPNIPKNIKQFFRNLRYAYQRIIKGYCDQDIWNLNDFYSELFYQTLHQLADTTIGYPGTDEFSDTDEGFEKWRDYLREMAEHFLNTQEWNNDIPINKERDLLSDKMNSYIISWDFEPCDNDSNTSRLVRKYSDENAYKKAFDLWLEKEKEAVAFRNKEKDLAFDMMKKWFFSLWD